MIFDLKKNNISLAKALYLANEYDVIYLDDKEYFEKVIVKTPNITIKGRSNSIINFNANNGSIIPKGLGGDGVKKYGTTGSATLTISTSARGFHMENVTVVNSYNNGLNDRSGRQAVAFKSEISDLFINNCRFIGNQDTLYVDYGSNNYIINSYIEGDVDFIFGSADCYFINCNIYAKKSNKSYYIAPNTYNNNLYGLVFIKCIFTKAIETECYLGRWWFPNKSLLPIVPKASFIECKFKGNIIMEVIRMHEEDIGTGRLLVKASTINDEIININNDDSLCNSIMKNVGDISDKLS